MNLLLVKWTRTNYLNVSIICKVSMKKLAMDGKDDDDEDDIKDKRRC